MSSVGYTVKALQCVTIIVLLVLMSTAFTIILTIPSNRAMQRNLKLSLVMYVFS